MKKLTVIGVIMIGITSTIALLSFDKKKLVEKSFGTVYCWQNQTRNIADLTQALLTSQGNWGTTCNYSFGSCFKLGGIEFTEELNADGGNDGQLALSEALSAVSNHYDSFIQDFDSYDFTVGGGSGSTPARIIIYKSCYN